MRYRDLRDAPMNRRRGLSQHETPTEPELDDSTHDGLKARHRNTEREVANLKRKWGGELVSEPTPPPGGSAPAFRFGEQFDAALFSWSLTEHFNYGGAVQLAPGTGGAFSSDRVEVVTSGVYRVSVATRFLSNDPFGDGTVPPDTVGFAWLKFSLLNAQENLHLPYALLYLDSIFSVEVAGSVTGIVALRTGDRFLGTTEIYYSSLARGQSENFFHTTTLSGELLWPDDSVVSDVSPPAG